MSGGIGQRCDDLELLDRRARPAVGDDQRQGIGMFRPDMQEMDVEPVDLGDEIGQRVEPRFAPPPVIVGRPILSERLHQRQLHALGAILDQLALGPAGGGDAPLELGQLGVRRMIFERPDGGLAGWSDDQGLGECPAVRGRGVGGGLRRRGLRRNAGSRLRHIDLLVRGRRQASCLRAARCRPSGPALVSRKGAERRAVLGPSKGIDSVAKTVELYKS